MAVDSGPPAGLQPPAQAGQLQGQTLAAFSAVAAAGGGGSGSGGSGSAKLGPITNPRDLEQLMRRMHFRSNKGLGPGERGDPGARCVCSSMSPAAQLTAWSDPNLASA